ncbi:2-iminobutanoate/2-iminopropanoate deaminase-like isoform X1 [Mytilus edulis]|uniref:2-iminobutanoate/2-iminopropanoate deaminase n=1 Tax=Mytilus galloprovincialis TaxID=29158 RepID=A0A8B6FTJ1_MYTGA|nr:2-iminobutanoate/2-iminopropanoate deaminase [Mytilus galloprovincialis]
MAGIVRKIIKTVKAPAAIGPYSQAVLVENTMYLSGQIGMDPSTGNLVSGGVVPETEQALRNMGAVLGAAGADFNNIVKATVLLQNMNDFAAVNDVYVKYFPKNYPARAAYQVAALPKGAQVEIEAVAILGEITDVEHTES